MPRAPDGTYTLPLPDVQPGEIISSTWANTTMNDIASVLEASLDRDGNGGMRAALPFNDGSVSAPGISWANEPSTGFYRAALGDMRVAILGNVNWRWRQGGFPQVWNGTGWETVLTDAGSGNVGVPAGNTSLQILEWDNAQGEWDLGAPLEKVPPGTVDGQRLSWDAGGGQWGLAPPPSGGDLPLGTSDGQMLRWEQSGSIWEVSDVLKINDSGAVVTTGPLNVGTNITVGGTVDGRDVAADGSTLDSHVGDSSIHFTVGSINHQSISGAGTRTHTEIDNHIGNGAIHFTEGSINHNNIQNNGTNSHIQIDNHIDDIGGAASIHFADTSNSIAQVRRSNAWVNGVACTNSITPSPSTTPQPRNLQTLSQAEYDATSKDPNTLYFIVG